jgi:hypothetical protein
VLHRADVFVHQIVAAVEIDAQRLELGLEIAGADPEDHPAARKDVERGDRAGGDERVAIGQYHDVGLELEPGGHGSDHREHDERILRIMPAAVEPPV